MHFEAIINLIYKLHIFKFGSSIFHFSILSALIIKEKQFNKKKNYLEISITKI